MLRRIIFYIVLICLPIESASALVSEGRPGVPYVGHVLFLQKKVIEDDKVIAVSLAYADPTDDTNLCRNRIDVFSGLDLFRDIPEKSWVLMDYELQSILIDYGFAGDADVTRVSVCPDLKTCLVMSEKRKSDSIAQNRRAKTQGSGPVDKPSLETMMQRLEIGRKLVKAARCRGCHNLEGSGPAHAPSLTWKRFKYEKGWLENYLKAPYRMRPAMSNLMMLNYTSPNAQPKLGLEELKVIAEYLTNVAAASAPDLSKRKELWQDYDCFACHAKTYKSKPLPFEPTPIPPHLRERAETSSTIQSCLNCHAFGDLRIVEQLPPGAPNAFAPDLLLSFEKLTLDYLKSFMANPAYLEPNTRMPDMGLDDIQIDEIGDFARQVKEAISVGSIKPNHIHYKMEKQPSP